jgi:hypothetical protein
MTDPLPDASTVSNPGEPVQDNGLCPIPTAIDIAKSIVRSARPEHRYSLWEALTKGIDAARQEARESGNAMPWETTEEIGWISWADFQGAVADALMGLEEVSERRRLVYVAKDAYDGLTARGSSTRPLKAGRYGIRVCARPGCGVRFTAKTPRHIWHNASCRASAHKEARRAAEAATGVVPVT